MKILHLISSIGIFGAENVVFNLIKEQNKRKISVFVGLISRAEGLDGWAQIKTHMSKDEDQSSVQIKEFRCGGKFNLKAMLTIRKFIKQNKIEIIHSHNYKSNFYSLVSTVGLKVKKMTTCHNWTANEFKMDLYKKLDKLLLKKFDKIIAVSEVLKDEIVKSAIDEKKIEVISNGVEVDKCQVTMSQSHTLTGTGKLQVKKSLNIKEDEKVVGTIGRLSEEKGHRYLIEAFAQVQKEIPGIKLLIVGDGPLKKSLQSTVNSQQMEDKVIFAGYRDDIPELLDLMDVFVLPSLDEGLPMVILEAGACKKPVIASSVGAISKIIDHNLNGLLVQPGNNDALAKAIIFVLGNEPRARLMGENIFEKVKNDFSARKMADEYLKIYKNVLR